ncbi:MAG: orotate phosphoribosyltransferase [Candidatus Hydrothermarchaeales archaeon]
MFSKSKLAELIKIKAVKTGEFILTSGKKSPYYIDLKNAYTDPKIMEMIVEGMSEAMRGEKIDRIAGIEMGGVPIATALSLKTGLPFIIIRKRERGHGTDKRIEGELRSGENVVVVEDVVTTGGSIKSGIEVIREMGGRCTKVIAVVDRLEGAAENLEKVNISVESLLTLKDL